MEVPEMQAARVAMRGVVRFLTAGLRGGDQSGSELTILAVLGPAGRRA
jgi:hypothetical protein